MSRNRTAILADIVEFNLDPNIAHKATHANGRLAKTVVQGEEQASVVVEPVLEAVVEAAPVVEETPVVAEVEPAAVTEEAPVEAPVEEPKAEEAPKKKGKKSATE